MSIFSTILQKLGLQKPAAAPTAAPAPGPAAPRPPVGPAMSSPAVAAKTARDDAVPSVPKPAPMAMVDVVSKLENLAGDNPGLDWKVSIVDLLKLLGIDSSLNARKELAK